MSKVISLDGKAVVNALALVNYLNGGAGDLRTAEKLISM